MRDGLRRTGGWRVRAPVGLRAAGLGAVWALALGVAGTADAQDWRTAGQARLEARRPVKVRPAAPGALRSAAAATVNETEPNDSIKSANPVTLGDTVGGAIGSALDIDFFAIDLTAGTTIDLDVDAQSTGSTLDPVLGFFDRDSVTVLNVNDDEGLTSLDSRIQFTITASGRYFIGIRGFQETVGPYIIKLGTTTQAPGDPTTLVASGLAFPTGVAASPTGDLLAADFRTGVLRVSPTGTVTPLVTTLSPVDLVVDGFGDLLVTALTQTAGRVVRITPAGQQSTFAANLQLPVPITVGPDGDVWVSDWQTAFLYRYDPHGTLKDSIDLAGLGGGAVSLAFSPAGRLHLSDLALGRVHRLDGRTFQPVVTDIRVEGLAFDHDGYLYAADALAGRVVLYDPAYKAAVVPLARNHLGPPFLRLVFLRSPAGAMTARLLAQNGRDNLSPPYGGGIVELNPAGIRAPGFRIGVDLLRIVNAPLIGAVMGASLSDTLRITEAVTGLAWSVVAGALPRGVTLSAGGVLSGVPEESDTFTFTVRVEGSTRFGTKQFQLVVARPEVSATDAADGLLGAPGVLTPALERFLDLQGNRNGTYDVGDLRAHLRARGLLPSVVAGSGKGRGR